MSCPYSSNLLPIFTIPLAPVIASDLQIEWRSRSTCAKRVGLRIREKNRAGNVASRIGKTTINSADGWPQIESQRYEGQAT